MAGGSHVRKTPKEAQYTHGTSGPRYGSLLVLRLPWSGGGGGGEGQLQGQASQKPWEAASLTLRVGIPVLRTAFGAVGIPVLERLNKFFSGEVA